MASEEPVNETESMGSWWESIVETLETLLYSLIWKSHAKQEEVIPPPPAFVFDDEVLSWAWHLAPLTVMMVLFIAASIVSYVYMRYRRKQKPQDVPLIPERPKQAGSKKVPPTVPQPPIIVETEPATTEQSDADVDQPSTSRLEPPRRWDSLSHQVEATVERPKVPCESHKRPDERKNEPVERPKEPAERLDDTVERPNETVERPNETVERPNETVERPEPAERPNEPVERPKPHIESHKVPAENHKKTHESPKKLVVITKVPNETPKEPALNLNEPMGSPKNPTNTKEPHDSPKKQVQSLKEPVDTYKKSKEITREQTESPKMTVEINKEPVESTKKPLEIVKTNDVVERASAKHQETYLSTETVSLSCVTTSRGTSSHRVKQIKAKRIKQRGYTSASPKEKARSKSDSKAACLGRLVVPKPNKLKARRSVSSGRKKPARVSSPIHDMPTVQYHHINEETFSKSYSPRVFAGFKTHKTFSPQTKMSQSTKQCSVSPSKKESMKLKQVKVTHGKNVVEKHTLSSPIKHKNFIPDFSYLQNNRPNRFNAISQDKNGRIKVKTNWSAFYSTTETAHPKVLKKVDNTSPKKAIFTMCKTETTVQKPKKKKKAKGNQLPCDISTNKCTPHYAVSQDYIAVQSYPARQNRGILKIVEPIKPTASIVNSEEYSRESCNIRKTATPVLSSLRGQGAFRSYRNTNQFSRVADSRASQCYVEEEFVSDEESKDSIGREFESYIRCSGTRTSDSKNDLVKSDSQMTSNLESLQCMYPPSLSRSQANDANENIGRHNTKFLGERGTSSNDQSSFTGKAMGFGLDDSDEKKRQVLNLYSFPKLFRRGSSELNNTNYIRFQLNEVKSDNAVETNHDKCPLNCKTSRPIVNAHPQTDVNRESSHKKSKNVFDFTNKSQMTQQPITSDTVIEMNRNNLDIAKSSQGKVQYDSSSKKCNGQFLASPKKRNENSFAFNEKSWTQPFINVNESKKTPKSGQFENKGINFFKANNSTRWLETIGLKLPTAAQADGADSTSIPQLEIQKIKNPAKEMRDNINREKTSVTPIHKTKKEEPLPLCRKCKNEDQSFTSQYIDSSKFHHDSGANVEKAVGSRRPLPRDSQQVKNDTLVRPTCPTAGVFRVPSSERHEPDRPCEVQQPKEKKICQRKDQPETTRFVLNHPVQNEHKFVFKFGQNKTKTTLLDQEQNKQKVDDAESDQNVMKQKRVNMMVPEQHKRRLTESGSDKNVMKQNQVNMMVPEQHKRRLTDSGSDKNLMKQNQVNMMVPEQHKRRLTESGSDQNVMKQNQVNMMVPEQHKRRLTDSGSDKNLMKQNQVNMMVPEQHKRRLTESGSDQNVMKQNRVNTIVPQRNKDRLNEAVSEQNGIKQNKVTLMVPDQSRQRVNIVQPELNRSNLNVFGSVHFQHMSKTEPPTPKHLNEPNHSEDRARHQQPEPHQHHMQPKTTAYFSDESMSEVETLEDGVSRTETFDNGHDDYFHSHHAARTTNDRVDKDLSDRYHMHQPATNIREVHGFKRTEPQIVHRQSDARTASNSRNDGSCNRNQHLPAIYEYGSFSRDEMPERTIRYIREDSVITNSNSVSQDSPSEQKYELESAENTHVRHCLPTYDSGGQNIDKPQKRHQPIPKHTNSKFFKSKEHSQQENVSKQWQKQANDGTKKSISLISVGHMVSELTSRISNKRVEVRSPNEEHYEKPSHKHCQVLRVKPKPEAPVQPTVTHKETPQIVLKISHEDSVESRMIQSWADTEKKDEYIKYRRVKKIRQHRHEPYSKVTRTSSESTTTPSGLGTYPIQNKNNCSPSRKGRYVVGPKVDTQLFDSSDLSRTLESISNAITETRPLLSSGDVPHQVKVHSHGFFANKDASKSSNESKDLPYGFSYDRVETREKKQTYTQEQRRTFDRQPYEMEKKDAHLQHKYEVPFSFFNDSKSSSKAVTSRPTLIDNNRQESQGLKPNQFKLSYNYPLSQLNTNDQDNGTDSYSSVMLLKSETACNDVSSCPKSSGMKSSKMFTWSPPLTQSHMTQTEVSEICTNVGVQTSPPPTGVDVQTSPHLGGYFMKGKPIYRRKNLNAVSRLQRDRSRNSKSLRSSRYRQPSTNSPFNTTVDALTKLVAKWLQDNFCVVNKQTTASNSVDTNAMKSYAKDNDTSNIMTSDWTTESQPVVNVLTKPKPDAVLKDRAAQPLVQPAAEDIKQVKIPELKEKTDHSRVGAAQGKPRFTFNSVSLSGIDNKSKGQHREDTKKIEISTKGRDEQRQEVVPREPVPSTSQQTEESQSPRHTGLDTTQSSVLHLSESTKFDEESGPSTKVSELNQLCVTRPYWKNANIDEIDRRVKRALRIREELQMSRSRACTTAMWSASESNSVVERPVPVVERPVPVVERLAPVVERPTPVVEKVVPLTGFRFTAFDQGNKQNTKTEIPTGGCRPKEVAKHTNETKLNLPKPVINKTPYEEDKERAGNSSNNIKARTNFSTVVRKNDSVKKREEFSRLERSASVIEDPVSEIENIPGRPSSVHTSSVSNSAQNALKRGRMKEKNSPPTKISKVENAPLSSTPKLVGELVHSLPKVPLFSFVEWFIETSDPNNFVISDRSTSSSGKENGELSYIENTGSPTDELSYYVQPRCKDGAQQKGEQVHPDTPSTATCPVSCRTVGDSTPVGSRTPTVVSNQVLNEHRYDVKHQPPHHQNEKKLNDVNQKTQPASTFTKNLPPVGHLDETPVLKRRAAVVKPQPPSYQTTGSSQNTSENKFNLFLRSEFDPPTPDPNTSNDQFSAVATPRDNPKHEGFKTAPGFRTPQTNDSPSSAGTKTGEFCGVYYNDDDKDNTFSNLVHRGLPWALDSTADSATDETYSCSSQQKIGVKDTRNHEAAAETFGPGVRHILMKLRETGLGDDLGSTQHDHMRITLRKSSDVTGIIAKFQKDES
ncbi:uncharacterized protein LOC131957287 [Physella acuta]|uniref:uncharacterized protein LOC131957287 n=1 Tax=Physella acuta TaxID=109671 RepID=UPI0027DB25C7|nr:uncharacterized protein LOC131957287 [Physella acuta]